jgi:Leucine-rich repeat (LRR) protein
MKSLLPTSMRRSVFVLAIALSLGCNNSSPPATPAKTKEREASLQEQWRQVAAKLVDNIYLTEQSISDADLKVLEPSEVLQTFVADEGVVTDDGCRQLAGQSELRHLRLRNSPISDVGLKELLACQKLEILNLPQSQITDDGLALLKQFPKLKLLRFSSPHVTSEGLKHLKELPSLTQIHLIDVAVTDAGLDELSAIEKLQSLYIDGATFSDEAIARLFEKHPKLHVHFDQQHHDRDPNRHEHSVEDAR